MKRKSISIILILSSLLFFSDFVRVNYRLTIWTYRQGPVGRLEVCGITSPSLHSIPMKDLDTCKKEGKKIMNEIYKTVWQFDSKWTCVFSGVN